MSWSLQSSDAISLPPHLHATTEVPASKYKTFFDQKTEEISCTTFSLTRSLQLHNKNQIFATKKANTT